jgi:hypothetical protein
MTADAEGEGGRHGFGSPLELEDNVGLPDPVEGPVEEEPATVFREVHWVSETTDEAVSRIPVLPEDNQR